ncbi:MAG: hypothetical protein H7X95_12060 [Deltaproteobacteria bacterium]|nr:hypothetical protein [Deltaproteobacteria bacterium]
MKLASPLLLPILLAACIAKVPMSGTKPARVAAPDDSAAGQVAPRKAALITGKFHCELGNRVEVRADPQRPDAIRLDWKGRSYPLRAVATSTGALRYEDAASGHVWIQIPAKSMLLNAKAGQQLANECHTR